VGAVALTRLSGQAPIISTASRVEGQAALSSQGRSVLMHHKSRRKSLFANRRATDRAAADRQPARSHGGPRPSAAEETFELIAAGVGAALSAGNARIYQRPSVCCAAVPNIPPSELAVPGWLLERSGRSSRWWPSATCVASARALTTSPLDRHGPARRSLALSASVVVKA
jgi:hypothetical protein